jgi:hypothetical protein
MPLELAAFCPAVDNIVTILRMKVSVAGIPLEKAQANVALTGQGA